jgi:hypothetical protein
MTADGQNNHADTPVNYDTYSIDTCEGAKWIMVEADGGCGGISFDRVNLDVRVIVRPGFSPKLPTLCNPCCSHSYPFGVQSTSDRCGFGYCPTSASDLDEVPCSIHFAEDATLCATTDIKPDSGQSRPSSMPRALPSH